MFRALIARRELLRRSTAARGLEIVGHPPAPGSRTTSASCSACPPPTSPAERGLLRLHLPDADFTDSKVVVIATCARYRALPLDRWPDFEGAGIYHAATELEARGCAGSPVTVVGGANCVCPGPAGTPLFRTLPDKIQAGLERAIPFRRLAIPWAVTPGPARPVTRDAHSLPGTP